MKQRHAEDLNGALGSSYWREEDARAVIGAWESSGLSLRAFARRHRLSPERVYRWKRRLGESTDLKFHPVKLVGSTDPNETIHPRTLELVMRDGRRVVIGTSFDPELLRRVVETVESWSC